LHLYGIKPDPWGCLLVLVDTNPQRCWPHWRQLNDLQTKNHYN
jgi:hypothetical protein